MADFPTCARECAFDATAAGAALCVEPDVPMEGREAAAEGAAKLPLACQPAAFFEELQAAWLSSYDLRAVHAAASLVPSARAVLPHLHASAVYDAAVAKGVRPLGIAPANCRGGKYAFAIAGNPARIYAGLAKLPHQAATKYSIA